jgi:hypothetical protein
MNTVTTNARPRRLLSDELDRLDDQLARHDSILDALSEGLNGAVADAARDGVQEAVMFAVINLLTDPALRAALYEAEAEAAALRGTRWGRLRARAVSALGRTVAPAGRVWRSRRTLLVAIGVGLAVAAVTYLSAPGPAAAVAGAVAAAAVRSGRASGKRPAGMTPG